ncbi:MAG TPA: hypothetical protein VNO55_06160 [Polyangia bacterium]|nr:hypothetical protein [Polyangia bacterium]
MAIVASGRAQRIRSTGRRRFARVRGLALALVAASAITVSGARAAGQTMTFPPVTSRDFNIDLFEQPAIGSPRLVAMAGAINSVAEGAAGLYTNPASAAVRPETTAEKLAWDIYFNSYVPVDGQDSNNNGQAVTSVRRSLLGAAGVMLQFGKWGLTVDGGYTAHEIAPQAGGGLGVRSIIPHLALARTFIDGDVAVGVGVRGGALNVYTLDQGQTLFTRAGASGEVGAVWKPREQSFRLALSGGLPVYTGIVRYSCDPNDCFGYILPRDAIVPWSSTVSGAWRWGPTPWNHKIDGAYRDERQLTVALDLSITGAVSNGYGMEAFAAKQLQASGRHATFTPRLGLESEVIPGWLRLRAGSYLEASRFSETSARWHATGGAQGRVFAFHLAGHERRVALSLGADIASRYKNVGLSIGFWN